MTKKTKWSDRLRRAFMSKDADEVEKLAKEAEAMDEESDEEKAAREAKEKEGKTGDALKQVLDKLKSMDADIQELKKAVAEDDESEEEKAAREAKEKEANDAILAAETAGKLDQGSVKLYTGDAAKHILPRLEILSPGFKLPTFDSKTTDEARANSLCKCQRKALDVAYQTDAGRAAITPFLSGMTADFDTLPAALVHAAFMGASELIRSKNNDGNRVSVTTRDFGKQTTVSAMNKAAQEFWANRSKH